MLNSMTAMAADSAVTVLSVAIMFKNDTHITVILM